MADKTSTKRKAHALGSRDAPFQKKSKSWRTPRQEAGLAWRSSSLTTIQPGTSGIFATCDKGLEWNCLRELSQLLEGYVEELYPEASAGVPGESIEKVGKDLEKSIAREIKELKAQRTGNDALIRPIHLDIPCVVFIAISSEIDPVALVHRICSDALDAACSGRPPAEGERRIRQQTRFTKRLTPITLTGRAFEKDLVDLATSVLKPVFHTSIDDGVERDPIKFAIRPQLRQHSVLTRMGIIERVAELVGERGKVDLKGYDSLILVEVYRNVLGMSVVGSDYQRLKRFNLSEIWCPTPPQAEQVAAQESCEVERQDASKPSTTDSLFEGPKLNSHEPTPADTSTIHDGGTLAVEIQSSQQGLTDTAPSIDTAS